MIRARLLHLSFNMWEEADAPANIWRKATPPLWFETADHQRRHNDVVVRQNDLIWNDLNFLCREVERHSARPWIWSDAFRNPSETFAAHVNRSVLQRYW